MITLLKMMPIGMSAFVLLCLLSSAIADFALPAQADQDSVECGTDGPVVIRRGDKLISYTVTEENGSPVFRTEEISADDSLYCFANDSRKFGFLLKKELPPDEECDYQMPEKLLAVSDIEGNFDGFAAILRGAGVINDKYEWSFGSGHLVLLGDFFDRGNHVNECLWLIYKLESESERAGGKVHFILGNHELMNLKGDFRYVRKKYFQNADSLGLPYSEWYSAGSELGRWLMTKNCIEKIGSTLFIHGGYSPQLLAMNLPADNINDILRDLMKSSFSKAMSALDSLIIRSNGPLWYRGIAKQEIPESTVDSLLAMNSAERIVIGHTLFEEICNLYGGKVKAIDIYHADNFEKGKMFALWYEKNMFGVIDESGNITKISDNAKSVH